MKRSEMLELMWREVMSTHLPCKTTALEMLDKALRIAEKNGMLPPKSMVSDEGWVDDGEGVKYKKGKIYARRWERE